MLGWLNMVSCLHGSYAVNKGSGGKIWCNSMVQQQQQQQQLGKMVKKEIYTAVLVTQHRTKAPKTKTKTRQNHHGKHLTVRI